MAVSSREVANRRHQSGCLLEPNSHVHDSVGVAKQDFFVAEFRGQGLLLPGQLLDELFQPVRIAPGYGGHFHAALTKRYPGVELPPLRELVVEECPALQPVPCLRFCSQALADSWGGTVEADLVLLDFDYAGIRLGGEQPSQVLVGDLNTSMWEFNYRSLEEKTGLRNARTGFGIVPTWPTFMPFEMIPIAGDGDTEAFWIARTETTWEFYDVFVFELDKTDDGSGGGATSGQPEADAITRHQD